TGWPVPYRKCDKPFRLQHSTVPFRRGRENRDLLKPCEGRVRFRLQRTRPFAHPHKSSLALQGPARPPGGGMRESRVSSKSVLRRVLLERESRDDKSESSACSWNRQDDWRRRGPGFSRNRLQDNTEFAECCCSRETCVRIA